jgi:putative addiction module component (TIGR02574 family)
MIAETIPQLRSMLPQEKFELVAELWEEVLQHEAQIEDPPGVAVMLEERLASYRAGETTGKSWEEVRAAIQNRD